MSITKKCLSAVPAVYFLSLAVFCIGMELYSQTLSWYWLWVYCILCLPAIIRNSFFWMIFGSVCSLIFVFLILAVWLWLLDFFNGRHFNDPLETFGVGFPFLIFSLLCSSFMIYVGLVPVGTILMKKEAAKPAP